MNKILHHPLFLGSFVFFIQLCFILLICPEKSLTAAWLNLGSHWDSEWYEAIAQYGYINNSFPQTSGLRTANIVFFPGYPYLARCLILLFGINAKASILIIAQIATWLFWCFLFYLLRTIRWNHQLLATLLIMFFPTSWFFFMGYAESLFVLSSCLMLWSATQKKWLCASLSGIAMTATRLIGIPALAAPFFATILTLYAHFKSQLKNKNDKLSITTDTALHAASLVGKRREPLKLFINELTPLCLIGIIGSLGCIGFLLYCQITFGSWHIYFDMERLFWSGTADPLFLFKTPTWLPPPIGYPANYAPPLPNGYTALFIFKFFQLAAYSFSETLVPLFLWLFILVSVLTYIHRKTLDKTSLTWFIAAILLLLFNCFSLSTRYYESMSRCLYPAWIMFIISEVIHPQGGNLFCYFKDKKMLMLIIPYLFIAGGFWLQLLNRYFLGWWVA